VRQKTDSRDKVKHIEKIDRLFVKTMWVDD